MIHVRKSFVEGHSCITEKFDFLSDYITKTISRIISKVKRSITLLWTSKTLKIFRISHISLLIQKIRLKTKWSKGKMKKKDIGESLSVTYVKVNFFFTIECFV